MNSKYKHKTSIGLVLNAVPRYSETFFIHKIEGLQQMGYRVVLFVEYDMPSDWDFSGLTVISDDFSRINFKSLIGVVKAMARTVFIHPGSSHRLFRQDRKDGLSRVEAFKRLIANEFLLRQPLDWLHFGFGMLAVGRESVADAIGAKMAVSFRGSDLYLSPLLRPNCYDLLFQKEVRYHVLSYEMRNSLTSQGVDEQSIQVITPAINTAKFKSSQKISAKGDLQLLTVARLHWKKGLEYTLESLSILRHMGIPFHYSIVGAGKEYERLKFAVHQLNLTAQVSFLGSLTPKEVRDKLDLADIYLQYSIQEGFCNAVLEAQAMGLLCIVSNAEGLAENVLDEVTGWVVEKRQPQLLAEKIREVYRLSEAEKNSIQTTARHRVEKDFNFKQHMQSFERFYTG